MKNTIDISVGDSSMSFFAAAVFIDNNTIDFGFLGDGTYMELKRQK